eukprot:jgi/Antlo1/1485/478
MYRACMLAIFAVLVNASVDRERITIQFCDERGNDVEKKDYNVHRVVFKISAYLNKEADKNQCSMSECDEYDGQTIVRLACDSRVFDIVADLLDDRALDIEVRGKDVVDTLKLGDFLKVKDDKMKLCRNLARAVVNDTRLRAEIETQNDVPNIKLFVLELMRDHVGMDNVDVRVHGNRAIVCPSDERQCAEHGLRDRIGVVDEMRIWDSAMDTLLKSDKEFAETLGFYVRKMDIRTLELDHCMLSEGIIRCIANMRCLTRLSMKELSNDVIHGLSSFQGLETLTELDISGNKMNKRRLKKIRALASLKKLDIENCGLGSGWCWGSRSADLRCIEGLEHLTVLNVSKNKLKRCDMHVIGRMLCLNELRVEHCSLKAGSIECIKNLENLKRLDVSGNRLSKKDIKAIGDIKGLERLRMSKCVWISCASMFTLNTRSFEYLKNQCSLTELDVSRTSLSTRDMVGIGKMKSLVKLDMEQCKIKPGSLVKLDGLDRLKELSILGTKKLNKKDRMFIRSMKAKGVRVRGDAES